MKYKAIRTEVDGIMFASKKEARRYQDLKLLNKAGEITQLKLQPVYPFRLNDKVMFKYIADFEYIDRGNNFVIEDVKGMKTPVYKLKKKLIEAQYGIRINEI
tara:strand:- start:498 stop:803 length:306 start_codon:yes stop_codon:yes gene_type:complete